MSGIIRFVEEVIGDRSLSLAQKVILKSIYGEPLTPPEVEIFCELSGLPSYRARERDELTIVAGRGSGKTNQLASNMAIFEAVGRKHQLAVGERGVSGSSRSRRHESGTGTDGSRSCFGARAGASIISGPIGSIARRGFI